MGIVKGSLRLALLASFLFGFPAMAQAAPSVPVAAKPHRTTWDLANYTWLRLVPREKGSAPNDAPLPVSAQTLIRQLEAIRALTPDGEEALFSGPELGFLAGAMAEALATADPSEDLVLLSGSKRGAGFLSAPLAVTARLFVKDGRLNLIVHDTRLEVVGSYSPQSDWPKYEHGSRSQASTANLRGPGALLRRADWLAFTLEPPAPAALPTPRPQAHPAFADQAERLKNLMRLREENLISDQEYQAKRAEILRSL